jgi:hypothetical protein
VGVLYYCLQHYIRPDYITQCVCSTIVCIITYIQIVWVLMMWVFCHVCSGVFWGMRESTVSDSGRRQWFFFLGRWYREWEEKAVSVVVVSLMRLQSCVGSVCVGDTTLSWGIS